MGILLGIFYLVDNYYYIKKVGIPEEEDQEYAPKQKVQITGRRNLIWLLLIIVAVFADPNIIDWIPSIHYHGEEVSFVREAFMLFAAFSAYRFANKRAIVRNEFSFMPIKEVIFVFIGIFATMMPALALVNDFAAHQGQALLTPTVLFFSTGGLSGFLDNAPTYLSFLTASMAAHGSDVNNMGEVLDYAQGVAYHASPLFLKAIALASVFFGAMTYVGNAPNFMVYSIAKDVGVDMPFFVQYFIKYSLPILLPLYILVWLLFIR